MNEERTVTTVKISIETWRRLTALKESPGDDFDGVISRLLNVREAALGIPARQ